MKKYTAAAARAAAILMIGVMTLMLFSGCGAPKYRVDYDGQKESFKGAKDEYRAGEKVRICYNFIATDTDYHFNVEGAEFKCTYEEGDGFVITFTMPEHDVKVTVDSVNSMVAYGPDGGPLEYKEAPTLSFHSFDGGGPEYSVEIADPTVVSCTQERVYPDPDHEELDGAPYDVVFTFTGLKQGSTAVTVRQSGPDGEEETEYLVTVNEALWSMVEYY